jgi:tRNA pseudouridine38-40 synthase
VHALRQVAHMHLDSRLDDDRLRHAINAHVAEGIVVRRAETCRDDFHARFDASSKRYLYVVLTTRFAPPFGAQYFHWTHYPLELEPMKRAARALVGTHDFKAFGNSGSPRHTTVRTIQGLRFIARKERLALIVQADGFLYNMVRTIAGTLLAIGRGRLDEAAVERALKKRPTRRRGADCTALGSLPRVRAIRRARIHRFRLRRARTPRSFPFLTTRSGEHFPAHRLSLERAIALPKDAFMEIAQGAPLDRSSKVAQS